MVATTQLRLALETEEERRARLEYLSDNRIYIPNNLYLILIVAFQKVSSLIKLTRTINFLEQSIIYNTYIHSVYSSLSSLLWEDKTLQSSEGVQQGDPLGPLLFCLAIHPLSTQLMAEFCAMYLDDVSLGGLPEAILHDLEVIESFKEIGLVLNNQKSEIICTEPVTRGIILVVLPGALRLTPWKLWVPGWNNSPPMMPLYSSGTLLPSPSSCIYLEHLLVFVLPPLHPMTSYLSPL